MKICIATGVYPPSIGGPATYSKLLFDELPKEGIKVEVLSYDEVRHLPKGISHFSYLFKLLKLAKSYDVIFAQDVFSVGLPSLIASKILRKKFIVRAAGDYAWEQSVSRFGVKDNMSSFQNKKYGFKTNLLKKIQTFVVSKSDHVIAPSKYFRDIIVGWGVSAEKVTAMYNGVNEHQIYDKQKVRDELNISKEAFVIMSAGRLEPFKGFYKLIEAFAELCKSKDNLQLYILGTGGQAVSLKKLIKKLNLEPNIFMVGDTDRDTMYKYLSASDVFVLNTHGETFSFQLVEAMQTSLPIVSTNVGSIPELIDNGQYGFLVEPDDVTQLVSVLENLINDGELRETMGQKAKDRSKLFSKENLIKNLTKILQ